jgi:hypothetical protein
MMSDIGKMNIELEQQVETIADLESKSDLLYELPGFKAYQTGFSLFFFCHAIFL